MMTVTRRLHLEHGARGRQVLATEPSALSKAPPSIPRVSRLMALALRFDELLRTGGIESLAALAEDARITQPRATQIVNLSLLAPDIIEELLHLPAVTRGRTPINERMLRPICSESDWSVQRRMWAVLRRARADRDRSPSDHKDAR